MPVGYLTSSSLIETVKREGMVPTSQNTFTDADFLAMANQELKISMLPAILIYHEEYFTRDSAAITIVANQSSYAIPYRATGGKFREVFYKDTQGQLRSMSRISPDHRPLYQQSSFQNRFIYFYLQGNEVVLVPDVGATPTGSLVFTYYIRPNDLVEESRAATITGISVGATTTTYTVDQIPQNLTPFVQDGVTISGFSLTSKLDLLQRRPGHKTISFDIVPTAINTTTKTITVTSTDVDSTVILGDYLSFAGECIIPQIPSDLHEVLVQRVIQRVMQALGDLQGAQLATAKLSEMEKNIGTLIDNRSEGNPQKVVNMRGLLRNAKIQRYRSGY